MRPFDFEEPVLNLELQEQIELARHGSLQPSDLETDIALLEEWLEPRPCHRCDSTRREWLQQPHLFEIS
jgi:hypothetical protein